MKILTLLLLVSWSLCSSALEWKYEYNDLYQYAYYKPAGSYRLGKTWREARSECMAEGGDLLAIKTMDEDSWIRRKTDSASNIWIGLNNIKRRDKWEWTDGSYNNLSKWDSDQPLPGKLCAHWGIFGREWGSDNCGAKKGFVCKRTKGDVVPKTTEPTPLAGGFCPSGWRDAGMDKCIKAFGPITEPLTWNEANERCQKLPFYKPDLASANTQDQVSSLTIIGAEAERDQEFWIGLKRYGSTSVWSDNTEVGITNWFKGVPTRRHYSSHCVILSEGLDPQGSWSTDDCDDKRNSYICQMFKDPDDIVSTPAPTPQNHCMRGYIPFGDSCYKLSAERKSYQEAYQQCVSDGAGMVSIHGAGVNAFLQMQMNSSEAWIGLEFDNNSKEYKWANKWYLNYVNLALSKQHYSAPAVCFLIQKSNGRWSDSDCMEKKNFICMQSDLPFTPPPVVEGHCPTNSWKAFGNSCYKVQTSSYNSEGWIGALGKCRKEFPGASLVSVTDEATNSEVHKMLIENNKRKNHHSSRSGYTWLGLHVSAKTGTWVWHDGTPLKYTKWAPNEPSINPLEEKKCAYMEIQGTNKGLWVSSLCSGGKGYSSRDRVLICKIMKIPPLTTPVPALGKCPSDEWEKFGAQCYLFKPDQFETWEGASEICEKKGGAEASLVRINSAEENEYVHYKMQVASSLPINRNFWIGLSKQPTDSFYVWSNGDNVTEYHNWGDEQTPSNTPSGLLLSKHCVQLNINNMAWENHLSCNYLIGYVCKVKVKDLHGKSGQVVYHNEQSYNGAGGITGCSMLLMTVLCHIIW